MCIKEGMANNRSLFFVFLYDDSHRVASRPLCRSERVCGIYQRQVLWRVGN